MVKSKAAQEATRRYEDKTYDRVLVLFPKGTKERIKTTGDSINGFTVRAVLDKLNMIESHDNTGPGD